MAEQGDYPEVGEDVLSSLIVLMCRFEVTAFIIITVVFVQLA